MSDKLAQEVRVLKIYALVSLGCFIFLGVTGFQARSGTGNFSTINVERINVRTADGKYAVVISNRERMPGNVVGGKERALTSPRAGGLLFYDREGDEAGGLLFDNHVQDSSFFAFGQLSLDRHASDQVASLRYVEEGNSWVSGLEVSHFPRGVMAEWHAARDSALLLPPSARDSAFNALRRRFQAEGKFEIKRLFAGQHGRTALLRLNDTRGRRRIQLTVDSLDVARLEFFDERGNVVMRIPQ